MSDNFFDPNNPDDDESIAVPEATLEPQKLETLSSLIGRSQETEGHRLESSFEDPKILEEISVGLGSKGDPASLVAETVDAVHELVFDPNQQLATSEHDIFSQPVVEVGLPRDEERIHTAPAADFLTEASAAAGIKKEFSQSGSETLDSSLIFETNDTQDLGAKVCMYEDLYSLVLCDHPFDVLVEKILVTMMKSVDAQVGSVLEFDSNDKSYFFRAARGGAADQVKSFRIPAHQGIVGFVGESRQTCLINNVDDDKHHLKSIGLAVGFEAKSCLATPIIVANQLYGVLEVFNKMGTIQFSQRDQSLLESGAKMAAKILEVRFFVSHLIRKQRG